MLARRIIPCLDVRDGRVVKGVRFRDHVDVGGIETLAARYRDEGADELVFYDITASTEDREVSPDWVSRVSALLDIPFCVAGGIKSVAAAAARLAAGADKISVNTPALAEPDLIDRLADAFGRQCVVVGVDSLEMDGDYYVRSHTGDPSKMRDAGRRTLDWIEEAVERGAGEVVLNCMNRDGVREGYDTEQLARAREVCSVPLIASGGAGAMNHFSEVFAQADVDGALAASVFHKSVFTVGALKSHLIAEGVRVRP